MLKESYKQLQMTLGKIFAKNIRRCRRDRKISQEDWATRVKLPRATINRWEQDAGSATLDEVDKIADAFSIDPIELLDSISEAATRIEKARKKRNIREELETREEVRQRLREPIKVKYASTEGRPGFAKLGLIAEVGVLLRGALTSLNESEIAAFKRVIEGFLDSKKRAQIVPKNSSPGGSTDDGNPGRGNG